MSFEPHEKLRIVIKGMKSDFSVTEICENYNISRKTYYNWLDDLKDSALNNWEQKEVGRKSDDEVSSLSEAKEKIKKLKQENQVKEQATIEARKEAALNQLEKDFIEFQLTDDDIDPEIKKKNREILKKNESAPDKNDGS